MIAGGPFTSLGTSPAWHLARFGPAQPVVAPPPALSIDDAYLVEGNAGTGTLQVAVRLSRDPAPGEDVSVVVSTANGTATVPDGDYVRLTAQTLTFTHGGPLEQLVPLTVRGDTTVEPSETFRVRLTPHAVLPLNATISDTPATVTIVNDDGTLDAAPAPSVSIDDPYAVEGVNGRGTDLVFTVRLSRPAPAGLPVTVSWRTAADPDTDATDPATVREDYARVTATPVTIPSGATTATVRVRVYGDDADEATETLRVVLSDPVNGIVSDPRGVGTIVDDDA